jgi:hypothetical protein
MLLWACIGEFGVVHSGVGVLDVDLLSSCLMGQFLVPLERELLRRKFR